MQLGLGLSLTARRASGFNPGAALLALLTPGATRLEILWPGYAYWFQDAAGTVPCTAPGQSVMGWRSMAGTLFAQATGVNAPVIAALPNGNLALQFDGLNDWLQSAAAVDFSASDKLMMIAGVRPLTQAAAQMTVEMSANAGSNAGTMHVLCHAGTNRGMAARGSATLVQVANSDAAWAAPTNLVLTGLADIAADSSILRINGAQKNQSSADLGSGNFGNHVVYLGRRGGSSLPVDGLIGPVVMRGGALPSTTVVADAEGIINGHMGAY